MMTDDANPQHQGLGVVREGTEFAGPCDVTLHGWFFAAASESPNARALLRHGSSVVEEHFLDNHAGILQVSGLSASPSTVVA